MARSNPPMDSAFVAELARRLQGQGSALALPLTWIEQRLAETGWTIQQMVQAENQKQAADQVSMSNSIGSLRFLSALDWRKFVETMSVVEQTLRAGLRRSLRAGWNSPRATSYRHVVERIAKYSGRLERDVARKAIELAHEGAAAKGEERAAHVGFYLVGEGVAQLERAVETRLPIAERLGRACRKSPVLLYVGGIVVITLIAGRTSGSQGARQPGAYLDARRCSAFCGCWRPASSRWRW